MMMNFLERGGGRGGERSNDRSFFDETEEEKKRTKWEDAIVENRVLLGEFDGG